MTTAVRDKTAKIVRKAKKCCFERIMDVSEPIFEYISHFMDIYIS